MEESRSPITYLSLECILSYLLILECIFSYILNTVLDRFRLRSGQGSVSDHVAFAFESSLQVACLDTSLALALAKVLSSMEALHGHDEALQVMRCMKVVVELAPPLLMLANATC